MKVSLLLAGALAVTLFVRHRSAALRHYVLAAAVVCAGAMPLLESMMPAWPVPIGRAAAFEPYDPAPVVESRSQPSPWRQAAGGSLPGVAARAAAPANRLPWSGRELRLLWLAGAGVGFGVLVVGLLRLTWLARRARPIVAGRWREMVDEISHTYGLQRSIALLQSDHPSMLVTWGLLQPKVILPAAADGWSEARARVVLSHELAHVSRGDWIMQIAAESLRAFYWFNPILWVVCRRLRLESEHACDDEVLRRGVEGTDYATHLVELARALNQRRHMWLPAPAMARPSSLERRVRAMLTRGVNRRPIGGVTRASVLGVLLLVAAAIAAAQSFVSFGGFLADEQGRGVPGTSVILSNEARQAKYEVKTNEFGRFEFVGLPAGEYGLEVKAIGFQTLKDAIIVKAQNLQRSYSLKLGTLEETISVRFDPHAPIGRDAPEKPPVVREARTPVVKKECVASPAGGRIVPPRKIRDVVPRYPRALEGTGTDGVVVMQARIDREGYPTDISVIGEAQPDLAQAAIEAVREWRYTETLLNCQPVDVTMTITTSFRPTPAPPPPAPPPPPAAKP